MNFEAAASESFQILRSFDYEVVLYDDDGKQVFEPNEARRFFAKPENLLVSIVDDGEDSSIRMYLSKSTQINSVLGLIDSLRSMATKYNMIFHVRKHGRVLSPKDFSTKAAVTESKDKAMKILEGMYGTSRSSYLKLENARLIVRHSSRVNENTLGARGRNVEHIYIENGVGERHLFPTTQLAPARAMAHHVNNGGSWADEVGEQIARMAQDFSNLTVASRHIYHCGNHLEEGAQDVRVRIREAMRCMRRTFESVCRKSRYDEAVAHLSERASTLNETDCTTKISEMAKMVNTDSRTLDESVLRSVVEALAGEDKRGHVERPMNTVKVLGSEINKSAWEAFSKHAKLEVMGKPDISAASRMRHKTRSGMLGFLLAAVAEKVKDDSMSNFLGKVADELQETTDAARAKNLRRVAEVALHAAGVRFKSEVPKTEAVKEFAEWIDSFNTNTVLVEGHFGPTDESLAEEFDPAEFLDYYDFDVEEPLTKEELAQDIERYLDHKANDPSINNSGYIEPLVKETVKYMQEHGYTITDALGEDDMDDMGMDDMADEDCEDCDMELDEAPVLSQEDVLLPKNQEEDLMGEVEPATVCDPDTGEEVPPDDQYINRLAALAGVSRR